MIYSGTGNRFIAIWRGGVTLRLSKAFVICFRTPLSRPFFSERNGYVKHLFNFLGFRLWISRK